MLRTISWIKENFMLSAAAVAALLTCCFVPPDRAYLAYADLRVLCLLLCLMAVVAGFQSCGAFEYLAVQLLRRSRNGQTLGVLLILLPFSLSMLITNDVALLTFVPFTLLLLRQIDALPRAIPVIVLQTIAANLGSMATPVGNPQNLFLYGTYRLTAGAFLSAMLPLTAVSLLCLAGLSLRLLPNALPAVHLEQAVMRSPKKLMLYGALFLLCLLSVLRLLPYWLLTGIVLAAVALSEPQVLRKLDYGLLATFICFFLVSGNLGRMEAVRSALQALLERSTLLTAVLSSQVISNVPTAVLLSGFTQQWRPLLQGVNIGGLGTPIASLASLISLKLYVCSPGARPGRYLAVFTLWNLAGLAVLLAVAALGAPF